MKTVFFYGLFMDEDLLRGKGYEPHNAKVVYAQGYGLRIGEKATLVKSVSETSFGVIMDLSNEEVDSLYSSPGVTDYVPEKIEVTELNGKSYKVICYNLPISKLTGSNKAYANSLSLAAKKMNLPSSYIDQILSWVE